MPVYWSSQIIQDHSTAMISLPVTIPCSHADRSSDSENYVLSLHAQLAQLFDSTAKRFPRRDTSNLSTVLLTD